MPRFGKWETIEELGKGGQGVVYLACQNGAAVEMKTLWPRK